MFGAMQAEVTDHFLRNSAADCHPTCLSQRTAGCTGGTGMEPNISCGLLHCFEQAQWQAQGPCCLGRGRFSNGMVGVSYVLNPVQVNNNTPVVTLGVEYDGQGLNGGLIAQFAQNVSAHVYLSDFQRLGAGLRYRLAF